MDSIFLQSDGVSTKVSAVHRVRIDKAVLGRKGAKKAGVRLIEAVRHSNTMELVAGDARMIEGCLQTFSVRLEVGIKPDKAQMFDQVVHVLGCRGFKECVPLVGALSPAHQRAEGVSHAPEVAGKQAVRRVNLAG
jgi:hypothetical protein